MTDELKEQTAEERRRGSNEIRKFQLNEFFNQLQDLIPCRTINVVDDCGGSEPLIVLLRARKWGCGLTVDGIACIEGRWSAVSASGTVPVLIHCREARPNLNV